MYGTKLLGMAFIAALALTPSIAATATAAPASQLKLTVNEGDKPANNARQSTLRCNPAGGNHPNPAAACAELAKVAGDISKMDVEPGTACTMQYEPITVTARGRWEGKAVDFTKTYGNPCVLRTGTGPLFSF